MGRSEARQRKRKRRGGRKLLGLLILIFVIIGTYVVYQYKQGQALGQDGQYKNDGEVYSDFQGVDPANGDYNVLLLGSDARGNEKARTDTIMVANYSKKTKQVKLISFMRDMYVPIPGHGDNKLNSAFAYGGPELVRQTIKQNFDLDINYYAIVDFNGFSKLVDIIAPNGIQVDVEREMSEGIGLTIPAGKQVLHGKETLGYVRFRQDSLSDFGRVQRQQEVLGKLKDEAVSVHGIMNLPKLLGALDPYVDTNLGTTKILAVGKGMMKSKQDGIQSLRLPQENTFQNARVPGAGLVLTIDFERNKQALKEFLAE